MESNWTVFERRRDQRETRRTIVLSCTKKAQTERYLQKVQSAGEKVLLEKEAGFRAEISLGESVRTRTLSCVSITSLNQDAHVAINADSELPH